MKNTRKILITILFAALIVSLFLFKDNLFNKNADGAVIKPNSPQTAMSLNVSYNSNLLTVTVLGGLANYRYQYWIKTKIETDDPVNLNEPKSIHQYTWQLRGTGFSESSMAQITVGSNDIDEDGKYNVIVRIKGGETLGIIEELYSSYVHTDPGLPKISTIDVGGKVYNGEDIIIHKDTGLKEYFKNQTVFSLIQEEGLFNGNNSTYKLLISGGTVTFKADKTFFASITPTSLAIMLGKMANPYVISGTYFIENGICYLYSNGNNMACEINELENGRLQSIVNMAVEGNTVRMVCQSDIVNYTFGSIKVKGNITGLTYSLYYGDSQTALISNQKGTFRYDILQYAPGLHKFRVEAINENGLDIQYFNIYIYETLNYRNKLIITSLVGNSNKSTGATTFTMQLKYANGNSFADNDVNLFTYLLKSGKYKVAETSKVINGNTLTVTFNLSYNGKHGIYQTIATVSRLRQNEEDDKVIYYYEGYAREALLIQSFQSDFYFNSSFTVNKPITITAQGGSIKATMNSNESNNVSSSNLRYDFYREDASGWILIKKGQSSTDNVLTWTPQKSGIYTIQVRVRDINAGSYEKAATKSYCISGTKIEGSLTLQILDYESNTPVESLEAGKPYKLFANYTNGQNDVLFMFTLKSQNLGLIYLNEYNPSPYFIFVPARSDNYTITARALEVSSFGYKDISNEITIKAVVA